MNSKNKKVLGASAAGFLMANLAVAYANTRSYPPLEVAPNVDLDKYAGEWYEIARLPAIFEKDCHGTKAEYTLADDGTIHVVNSCHKGSLNGKVKTAKGKAYVVDQETNAKLKVQFYWPFKGDYWILEVGDDYQYALVGEPSRKHMWILSREPQINLNRLQNLINKAKQLGFNTDKLVYTSQIE